MCKVDEATDALTSEQNGKIISNSFLEELTLFRNAQKNKKKKTEKCAQLLSLEVY